MATKLNEQTIEKYMASGKYSREEAIELIQYDIECEKMDLSDIKAEMTEEEKQAMKQAKKQDRKPRAKETKPRERKVDSVKREIIDSIYEVLKQNFENVEIENPEKYIVFSRNGESFKINLTKSRTPKNSSENPNFFWYLTKLAVRGHTRRAFHYTTPRRICQAFFKKFCDFGFS